jgi:antitoxin VapB
MALSIKNRELEEVSRELARVTGKPITEALLEGARRELERQKALRQALPNDNFLAGIREIQNRVAKLPILDNRPMHEILYDENGLPK